MPTYENLGFGGGGALTGDRARSVFGHVMGLVAFTLAFAALGAYVAKGAQTGGFIFFIGAIGCIFGLNRASARGHEQLALALLFGMGLLLGMFVSPILVLYAHAEPGVVYQSASATALFVAALGAFGYTTRRDLSQYYKAFFIAFIVVLVFGLVAMLVMIPHANVIYAVAMLVIFGGFTAFDFQRLAHSGRYGSAVPIAAAIFLDVFNVFLLMLSLFGGGGGRR